jgi:hypothetical protein
MFGMIVILDLDFLIGQLSVNNIGFVGFSFLIFKGVEALNKNGNDQTMSTFARSNVGTFIRIMGCSATPGVSRSTCVG